MIKNAIRPSRGGKVEAPILMCRQKGANLVSELYDKMTTRSSFGENFRPQY